MSENSAIEWTTHTFNPWWGCSRVSPACRFCYADRDAQRYGHQVWRRHGPRRMLSEQNWARPLKWDRDAERAGVPAKVFCASMADVFEDHPDVAEPRERLWELIDATPHLIWQLLTKRPENIAQMVPWGRSEWPSSIWIGASAENQRYADTRIPLLLDVPAKVRFLSCEPLLGPVDLTRWMPAGIARWQCSGCRNFYSGPWREECPGCGRRGYWCGSHAGNGHPNGQPLSWIISGGESGPKARLSHPDWFRALRDQCQAAGVAYFFKQWGEWGPRYGETWTVGDAWRTPQRHRWINPADGHTKPFGEFTGTDDLDWARMFRVGKKAAGRELDGRVWDQFPHAVEAVAS